MSKSNKTGTIKCTLYLPESISEILKNICVKSGLTINGLIKSVLFDYLTNNNYISPGELIEKKH